MQLPFSQACENNSTPIVSQLQRIFSDSQKVLEIGSGTGQHSVHFAPRLAQLQWFCSDRKQNHEGIEAWHRHQPSPNLHLPMALDVNDDEWPLTGFDAAFSANTAHIMSWLEVERMFTGLSRHMLSPGRFCLYGPFKYDGQFTSISNANFDQNLRSGAVHMGIRDIEAIAAMAKRTGFSLLEDIAMPANNRLLVFGR